MSSSTGGCSRGRSAVDPVSPTIYRQGDVLGYLFGVQSPSRFDLAVAVSRRRATTIGAVAAFVIGAVVAIAVSIVIGVVILVVAAAAWVLWVQSMFAAAHGRVVDGLGAEPAGIDDEPALHEALANVALQTGVAHPEVRVVRNDAANAMVAADGDTVTVVVTSGLLSDVRWIELEVVAAELLCRVRDGSARLGTLAAGLPGWLASLSGLSAGPMASVLGDQRATLADLEAVGVTRYPPALIATLERMEIRGTLLGSVAPATAPLWIAPAVGPDQGVDPAVDETANQPLDYRIAVLREL